MTRPASVFVLGTLVTVGLVAGCAKEPCSVAAQTGCASGEVCEEIDGSEEPGCFAPLSVTGHVQAALGGAAIAGARIVARDADGTVVSPVAISGADGSYALQVPAKRTAEGTPVARAITLRADAPGFLSFPRAPRVALPIQLASASGTPPTVKGASTELALNALDSTASVGTVAGHVRGDAPGGVLVVAGGATGISDPTGAFVVFNVPAGTGVVVRGVKAGVQIPAVSADVSAGEITDGVELVPSGAATAKVSGKVNFNDAGGLTTSTVVLGLEETFEADRARSEVPAGLRVDGVTGDFTLSGVPDGQYVVLAAFDNDGLVRDPDTSHAGTAIVHVTVAGADVTLSQSFAVTEALVVVSPGADGVEEVSGTPTFRWADDAGEEHYEVELFDALGSLVWADRAVPGVSGSAEASRAYDGPALVPGMTYQFRVTSVNRAGAPLSTTEDLRGVFEYR